MSQAAITVEGLSKAYRIGIKEEIPDTLMSAATSWLKAPVRNYQNLRKLNTFAAKGDNQPDILWALRDVSFEVTEGEVLGVIGRNGAGKSTLLKILSRITEPTHGRAVIRGRVSSLLEVGTGFHQELSGRENIYMNGTILGMRKKEIDRKLDEIIEFSGVERFLDTPIKRYSSGMKVRLAFAVAAHLEPEILIIDEVLAVGDAEFQKKCLGKMQEVAKGGRTVLFVSHNMGAVRSLTTKSAYLQGGGLKAIGDTPLIIDRYHSDSVFFAECAVDLAYFRRNPRDSSPVRFAAIRAEGGFDGVHSMPSFASGSTISLNFEIEATEHLKNLCLTILLMKDTEQLVATLFSPDQGFFLSLTSGRHKVQCDIQGLPLAQGRYSVTVGINQNVESKAYDVISDFPVFDIHLGDKHDQFCAWPTRPQGVLLWQDVSWNREPRS